MSALKIMRRPFKILDSFVSAEQGVHETYVVAAQAFCIGQYEKALTILDKAVAQHGTDIQLLDLIGDCYLKLGKKEEALAVWQKSLEINPEQPEVKRRSKRSDKDRLLILFLELNGGEEEGFCLPVKVS